MTLSIFFKNDATMRFVPDWIYIATAVTMLVAVVVAAYIASMYLKKWSGDMNDNPRDLPHVEVTDEFETFKTDVL